MMGLDGSPSKSYVSKFHGRSQLRKNFVQGALIGLTTIFLWTSLRLIWPKADSQSFSNTKQIPDNSKPSLVAFVGVQSGFSKPHARAQYRYELRREILRRTWFPHSKKELDTFEKSTGIRVRFVMGHTRDATMEYNLQIEQKRHQDIEDYLDLPYKTLSFLRYVSEHFNAKYIVKIDDDVYLRVERLPYAVQQWTEKEADYIGCMKRGEIFYKENMRWREPQRPIIGKEYYTHTWGCAYAISGHVASFFSSIPEGSLRFLNNEDTTIGSWMLAFNVTYFDDRRFCTTECLDTSLAIFDFPKCAGLCDPPKSLAELFKDKKCHENPNAIPLVPEILTVNTVRSRKLPPAKFIEGMVV